MNRQNRKSCPLFSKRISLENERGFKKKKKYIMQNKSHYWFRNKTISYLIEGSPIFQSLAKKLIRSSGDEEDTIPYILTIQIDYILSRWKVNTFNKKHINLPGLDGSITVQGDFFQQQPI